MINTRQRLYLRKLAQTLPTKFQLGKEALVPDWISAKIYAELEYRIPKFNQSKFENGFTPSAIISLFGSTNQEEAETLIPKMVKSLKADLVQTIGHRVVIYRAHPTEPKIVLPT